MLIFAAMEKKTIKIDGVDYELTPLTKEQKASEDLLSIRGKYTMGYYCNSIPNSKKWRVELRKPFAKLLKGKNSHIIGYFETREEAEEEVKRIDNILDSI